MSDTQNTMDLYHDSVQALSLLGQAVLDIANNPIHQLSPQALHNQLLGWYYYFWLYLFVDGDGAIVDSTIYQQILSSHFECRPEERLRLFEMDPLGVASHPLLMVFQELSISELRSSECSSECLWQVWRLLLLGSEGTRDCSALQLHDIIDLYEDLLALKPQGLESDNHRKTTGSYYTPDALVDIVLQSTLQHRMVEVEQEGTNLLSIRICDPSCGTGHFLVLAARQLAQKLCELRKGDAPQDFHVALQEVLQHCIYGVDINPLSRLLCVAKLLLELPISMWRQSTPLMEHIRCGNAVLGLTKAQVQKGIVLDNFTLIKNRDVATFRKIIIKKQRQEQRQMRIESNDLQSKDEADLILASYVWPKSSLEWAENAPTSGRLHPHNSSKVFEQYLSQVIQRHRFFHWHLEFAEVFQEGGFDVVIGNPPYLDSEFFKRQLPYEREAINHLYISAKGNWDIYIPFTELGMRILKPNGFLAYVTPSNIIGADYAKVLHAEVLFPNRICEIHDFTSFALFTSASVGVVAMVLQKTSMFPGQEIHFFQYEDTLQQYSRHTTSTLESLKQLPAGYISFPITSPEPKLLSWMSSQYTLKDFCKASDAATAGESYEIQRYIFEGSADDWNDVGMVKLINTGTIDPFRLLWGRKKIRYLGFKGFYPCMKIADLQQISIKRYQESQRITVAIAGLAFALEAAVVPKGVLSGKSTVLLQMKENICPYAIAALLNSQSMSQLYIGLFAMRSMSGKALNIGARQLEKLPVPPPQYLQPFEGILPSEIDGTLKIDRTMLSYIGKRLHQEQHCNEDLKQILDSTVHQLMEESL